MTVFLDAIERGHLCDVLLELGPDAPTLLPPWKARDLVAHVVLREHDYILGSREARSTILTSIEFRATIT